MITTRSLLPPRWYVLFTALFTFMILIMAVAETTLWTHYLVDRGEYLSLLGLAFVLGAGYFLRREKRLWVSLPFTIPWLMYPVITQGDQIIDNLTINQMRFVTHLLLALIFAAPIVILVLSAYCFLQPRMGVATPKRRWTKAIPGLRMIESGNVKEGASYLTITLLLAELCIAQLYLGSLMIMTLVIMGISFLAVVSTPFSDRGTSLSPSRKEVLATRMLIGGVALSLALFVGYKNRPGAYQGSPHFFHDPTQRNAVYALNAIDNPADVTGLPSGVTPEAIEQVLDDYGRALTTLIHGYYILDRNYNYAFHNALFLRSTSVLPDFRDKGLTEVQKARSIAQEADLRVDEVHAALTAGNAVTAFVNEVQRYVAYSLQRAAILEEMTGRFEQTQAGLQHATHLYEGEGKMLGTVLMQILEKHSKTLEAPGVKKVAETFVDSGKEVYRVYANRIVGF